VKRILLFGAIAALGVVVVLGARRFPRLAAYYGPVGECVTTNIDLDRPDPYIKLRLEGTAVGFAASGGGSRAAYLTAAVLREIRRSGLTARARADDAPWREFSDKMAYSYRPNEYWEAALSPVIWAKALFTNYNRGVLARQDYDKRVFAGATLASLQRGIEDT